MYVVTAGVTAAAMGRSPITNPKAKTEGMIASVCGIVMGATNVLPPRCQS